MSKNVEARRKEIVNHVNQSGTLQFSQLKALFPNISEVTLRKDLNYLDENQCLIRTHGAVKSIPSVLNYFYRSNIHQEEKKYIAAKAAKLIKPNSSVFIAAGTTCAELARHLPPVPFHLVTDGIYTASSINTQASAMVEMLGGELDLNAMRVCGLSALNRLESLHFNISFLSASSMHLNYGFSQLSAMAFAFLSKVIEHSDCTVILLDSSKVSNGFSARNIPFDSINILVSDGGLDENIVSLLQQRHIQVIQ